MATMRTTPRSEGAARRTGGGAAAFSSWPGSGGRSVVGSVSVIARFGVGMTHRGLGPRGSRAVLR